MFMRCIGIVALFFLLNIQSGRSIVAGIDYGSYNYKTVLVKPGSIDAVLNDESSRATPSAVGFDGDDRLIGQNAWNLISKRPKTAYIYASQLFAKSSLDHPYIQKIKHHIPYYDSLVELEDEAGHKYLAVQHDANTTYRPETLVAMQLMAMRKTIKNNYNIGLYDVVLTVPIFYTQYERHALLQAARIAGLNPLALVNTLTAVATKYGGDRSFEEPELVLFYDFGHSSIQVALVNYTNIFDAKKNKTVGQMSLVATAWDDNIGGRDFEYRLADWIEQRVLMDNPTLEITPNIKGKIMKRARKVKHVLSANKATNVNIEGLSGDYDFQDKITREEFEELNADLLARVLRPIERVLADSGVEKSDIKYVELFGGSSRVPKVQEMLKTFFDKTDLDRHIDSAEAAVFGAAFFGAILSPNHITRRFKIKDATQYPIQLKINSEPAVGEDEPIDKLATLFKKGNRLGSKKTISFYTNSNFSLSLSYEDSDLLPEATPKQLGEYEVYGIPTKEDYNFTNNAPKVHVEFRLNPSGIVYIDKAKAEFTVLVYPKPKKVNVTENVTITPESTTEDAKTDTKDAEKAEGENATETGDETEKKDAPEPEKDAKDDAEKAGDAKGEKEGDTEEPVAVEQVEEEEEEIVPVKKTRYVTLKLKKIEYEGMTAADVADAKAQIKALGAKEKAKQKTEESRNTLESYVYETKDRLYDDIVIEHSTEEEREALREELSEAGDWIYDDGADVDFLTYDEKLTNLTLSAAKIFQRVIESVKRPEASSHCRNLLNLTRRIMPNATLIKEITDEELAKLLELCDEVEAWLDKKETAQAALALHEDPVVTSSQIKDKCEPIQWKGKSLLRRPKRKPKVEEPVKDENATETSDETAAEGEPKKEDETAEQEPKDTTSESGDSGESSKSSESSESGVPNTEQTDDSEEPSSEESKKEL